MTDEAGPSKGRWKRPLAALAGTFVLAAGLIQLIRMPGCVDTRLLVVAGAYDDTFVPPGGAAHPAGLLSLGDGSRAVPDLTAAELADLDALLSAGDEEVVVVSLDAALAADADGPYVVADHAALDRPTRRFVCEELVNAVMERSRRGAPTVVVLDVAKPESNWRAGVLAPTAAARLLERFRQEFDAKPAPTKLVVLAAAGPGETAWSADGRSVFGRFVEQGLGGAADADSDDRVSADELCGYVCDRTADWVARHLDPAGQHPVRMPARLAEGQDFDVAVTGETTDEPWLTLRPDTALLGRLEQAWRRRDDLRSAAIPAYHGSPLHWRRATSLLSRAEALARVGRGEAATALLKDAESSLRRLEAQEPPVRPPAPAMAPADRLRSFAEALPEATRDRLDRVVEMRSLAETAPAEHPSAVPLVKGMSDAADQARRRVEDAIFLGIAEEVDREGDVARALYERASRAAADYDATRFAHERFAAELPDLAAWVAAQPASEIVVRDLLRAGAGGEVTFSGGGQDPTAELSALFAVARQIGRGLLELESSLAADPTDQLAKLRRTADEAIARLDAFEKRLEQDAAELRGESAAVQGLERRRRIDAALANPLLTAKTRRSLFVSLTRTEEALREENRKLDRGTSTAPARDDGETRLADRAAWQGLWAVQVQSLSPAADRQRLWEEWKLVADRDQAAATRRDAAERLGSLLRDLWGDVARELNQPEDLRDSVETARAELVRRDRLSRAVHGYDADRLAATRNPTGELAQFVRAESSLFLAGRYLDDFYAGDAGGDSWFTQAAGACLAVTESDGGQALRDEAASLRALLNERRDAVLRLRDERVLFGVDARKSAAVELELSGKLPSGRAAVWLEGAEPVAVVEQGRQALPIGATSPSRTADARRASFMLYRTSENGENCREVRLPARLFFRGHRGADETAVAVDPCPPAGRVVAYTPASAAGSLFVSGSDRRSILFVVDCSYSMKERLGTGSRFGIALATLKETIERLQGQADGGAGHRVGLMAFSHRLMVVGNNPVVPNPNWPGEKFAGNPYDDIQVLAQVRPLVAANAAKAIADGLRDLEFAGPAGLTPLVRAIKRAIAELKFQRTGGAVVVISDGAPSQHDDPIGDIKPLLDAAGVPIQLHIVGFAVADSDRKALEKLCKDSGGKYYNAPDGVTLTRQLDATIKPRPYAIVPVDRPAERKEYPLGVAAEGLVPGRYQVEFPEAEPREVVIAGGERLNLSVGDGRLIVLKYQSDPKPTKSLPAVATGSAPPASAANALVHRRYRTDRATGEAEFVLSLDRIGKDGPVATEGFVPRPAEVRFEVTGPDELPVDSLTWELATGHDLPTWRLSVPLAGDDRRAAVTARWRATAAPVDVVIGPDDRGNTLTLPAEGGDFTLKVGQLELRPEQGIVKVRLEGGDTSAAGKSAAELEHLGMRIGTENSGTFAAEDAASERRYYPELGVLECEFRLAKEFDPATVRLGVTSVRTWRNGAAEATLTFDRDDRG